MLARRRGPLGTGALGAAGPCSASPRPALGPRCYPHLLQLRGRPQCAAAGGGAGANGPSSRSGTGSAGLSAPARRSRRSSAERRQEAGGGQRRRAQREDGVLKAAKAANNNIKGCKALSDLQHVLAEKAADLNEVCVSTAWVRAAHLCTDEPPRAAAASRSGKQQAEQEHQDMPPGNAGTATRNAQAPAAAAGAGGGRQLQGADGAPPAPPDATESAAAAKAAAEEEEEAWWRKPQGERLEEGHAFARDVLLGLTPTWLPKMGMRQAANTLWAMGKLRLDLAAEGERGQKAAAAVEARLLELLAKPGLQDARDAEQLWLGLFLCTYGWSDRLLRALTDATLAKVVEWSGDVKALTHICTHMPHMLEGRNLRIGPQQRAALAEAIRRAVSSPRSNQQDLLRGGDALLFAAAELDLPLDPSTVQRLHGLVFAMPLERAKFLGLKLVSSNLVNATRVGYQPTAAEAQGWLRRFQDLTGRSTDTWTAEEFGHVVGAFEECRAFSPPPEMLARLRREVEALPPQEGEAQRGTLPGRLQLACTAWGVQRPLS